MRIEQLTFTRFIAAISIVIFHYGKESQLFSNFLVNFIFKQANVAVSYFFLLSGFVMIIAYHKKTKIHFLEFIKNRLARIYPVYLLAIILLIMLLLFSKNNNFNGLFFNLFMLQSWFPKMALSFNVPAWSLSVEMFFYLIFPFLFNKFYFKTSFNKLLVIVLVLWILTQIITHIVLNIDVFSFFLFQKSDLFYHPIFHLNSFLIGNVLGIYLINKKEVKKNYDLHIIITVLLLFLALKFNNFFNFQNGLLAVFFVPFIYFMACNTGLITKLFNNKKAIILGEISFSIYILQYAIWEWFSNYRLEKLLNLNRHSDFSILFFIRLVILILISYLIYVYIENPLRNKLKSLKNN